MRAIRRHEAYTVRGYFCSHSVNLTCRGPTQACIFRAATSRPEFWESTNVLPRVVARVDLLHATTGCLKGQAFCFWSTSTGVSPEARLSSNTSVLHRNALQHPRSFGREFRPVAAGSRRGFATAAPGPSPQATRHSLAAL